MDPTRNPKNPKTIKSQFAAGTDDATPRGRATKKIVKAVKAMGATRSANKSAKLSFCGDCE